MSGTSPSNSATTTQTSLPDTIQSPVPWVTYTIIILCSLVWGYLTFARGSTNYEEVYHYLCPSGFDLWAGQYWGLLTTAFVHLNVWHILFNMWWAMEFGRILEQHMGRTKYLLFIICSALVSSGIQLIMSDQTGTGYSGVIYAMFGFGLVSRRMVPCYHRGFNSRTAQWILGWFVLCVILTLAGKWNAANAAHVAGFVFGVSTAMAFILRIHSGTSRAILGLMGILTLLSITCMPWSKAWRERDRASHPHHKQDQNNVIEDDPEEQFLHAMLLLEDSHSRMDGLTWLQKLANKLYFPAMNELALILATDSDPAVKDVEEAILLAENLCQSDGWITPEYVETLAIAYAAAERWEEAIVAQNLALELSYR